MGNRAIPTALKLLRGNPGKKRINHLEPQPWRGIPTMPRWLKAFPVAVKEWRREAKELDDAGVMTPADAGCLAMRSYLASQIQELAMKVKTEGGKYTSLKNLITEHRQLGSLLGLDPSSRAGLKIERKRPMGKVEGFMRSKDGA